MNAILPAAFALVGVVLLHGAAAGIRASAGRDGRVYHQRAEGLGAARGMVVAGLLLFPVAIVAVIDVVVRSDRLNVYVDAAHGMLAVYGPVAVITALAFVVARTAPWQARAYTNSIIIGGLEFMRPVVALAGAAVAYVLTGDLMVLALSAVAVAAGLQVSRVVTHHWYSQPARMPDVVT